MVTVSGWCADCRARRTITDQHDESFYSGLHEQGYIVTEFGCGHESTTEPRIIGSSPGGESVAEDQEQRRTRTRLARSAEWNETHA